MPHDLTWVVSGCFCMFLPVFVKLIFLNIVFVCFCGAYFLMVSFNASFIFASPPSSMSDFTCWFKREPGTIYLFVYTKNHCSVYLCVEARIYWTLNRFASVQFSKIDTSLKVLKFGSKVGSQSNAACTDRSTRSKRQGTGIICLVFTCFTTFSMHQDDPEHKHKIRHSSHLSNQRCPTGHRGGNCLWMSSSCCCCGRKCLFVFADRLPLRVRIVSSWMTCEMQLLVGWGSAFCNCYLICC